MLIGLHPSRASRGALRRHVGHHPGDVADRTRSGAIRGREAVVDRVHLAEFHDDRPPRGEGGRVVEDHVVVPLAVDEQDERVERHVVDDLERADVEVLAPPRQRGPEVVDPVADVVNYRHAATHRNVFSIETTLVAGSWNCAKVRCRTSRTACSPAAWTARAPPAEQRRPRTALSTEAYRQQHMTSPWSVTRRPASARAASRWPGAERAYGAWSPACSGGMERAHGLVHDRALGALGRREQAGHDAAVRAGDAGRFGSAPAAGRRRTGTRSTPSTASNAASSNGRNSMSPSRRSAPGSRSRAMPSRPGLMSRPLGTAPRWAARTSASPEPQPTSSTRLP